MTRAEDRLIVCGFHGKQAPRPSTWHSLVSAALVGAVESIEIKHPIVAEQVHRFRMSGYALDVAPEPSRDEVSVEMPPLPETLLAPLPPARTLPRPLAPSRRGIADDRRRCGGRFRPLARARSGADE